MYDDRLTFLLPRPVWVNDTDVSYCTSCNIVFSPLKRRHHCRNCGNIYCHECSSRNVPLPQLGYGTKPVKVCNNCFDVAYLVTYCIDEDHGLSTQMHGVRGLLQLAEKEDETDLHNMIAYGGVDALIWLCKSSRDIYLHHTATTILSTLSEKESVRPVILTKWALPPLLFLIQYYAHIGHDNKSPGNSIKSAVSSLSHHSSAENAGENTQNMVLEIILNCTHILFQLARAHILSQKEVISDGILAVLLKLALFTTADIDNQQDNVRSDIIRSLAAKSVSAISSLGQFQDTIILVIQSTDGLPSLLMSSNSEVQKYMAKTVAYLSLRNEKYKADLLKGVSARALISIIAALPQQNEDKDTQRNDLDYYFSKRANIDHNATNEHLSATISHICCALANLATNSESQMSLMSQPHLLQYLCNVPAVFPSHTEIHRHVARCIANLTLYENNIDKLLSTQNKQEEGDIDPFDVLPTLLAMGQSPRVTSDIQRQIIRAIDNLSSHVCKSSSAEATYRADLFEDSLAYVEAILEDGSDKDADTIKRAKSIMERVKILEEKKKTTRKHNKKSKNVKDE